MTLENLSQITTAYGLLEEDTKNAMQGAWEAGCGLEAFDGLDWFHVECPNWHGSTVYRVKSKPVRRTLYRDFGISGRHVITCDPTGENPTVEWEPSE